MTKTAKILIIDDDIDFVAATKMVLESGNYEVITAHQGDEGLTRAGEERPNLIILDVIEGRAISSSVLVIWLITQDRNQGHLDRTAYVLSIN